MKFLRPSIFTMLIIFAYSVCFSQNNAPPPPPENVIGAPVGAPAQSMQVIDIPKGWSGISSFIQPAHSNVEIIFQDIMDNLIILQGQQGFFWPEQNINTLVDWTLTEGYIIKVNQDVELSIVGIVTDTRTLSINSGWNLIPVLDDCNFAVSQIFNSPEIIIVKEIAGSEVYWPELNINTLETINSGKAYNVFATSNITITFPPCFGMDTFNGGSHPETISDEIPWTNPLPTPHTHSIAIKASAFSAFNNPMVLGAFSTNGQCYGISILNDQNTCITLFGDDLNTIAKDGFDDGEVIEFRIFDMVKLEEENTNVIFDASFPQSDHSYKENGLSVITNLFSTTSLIQETNDQTFRIYPNPADNYLKISVATDQVFEITIVDMQGSIYFSESHSNGYAEIDVSNFKKGIYTITCKLAGKIKHQTFVVQ